MRTLLLRLNAPLQSWGSSSLYDNRETDYFPTKSGVIGILAAALGRKRDADLSDLIQLRFGIRIDVKGTRINDFQITEMSGAFGEHFNSNIANHTYLSDATFLIGLSSKDEDTLVVLQKAIRNPKFALFLGRRSCPPTLPMDMGISNKDLYPALYDEPWLIDSDDYFKMKLLRHSNKIELRIITDDVSNDATLIKDVPISFSSLKREYKYRGLREMNPKTIFVGSEHDPMLELR